MSSMDISQRAFLEAIGLRVRQHREAQRLTQAQLGERAGLHRTFIGSVERGERNVAVLNLLAIAQALRVTVASLLAEGGDA
jgi:transcriptional regulator with XRE-family HTH domain